MEKRTLGATGIEVSRLCFGTLTMSPMQANLTPEEGGRLLSYAYERGVNFLDTAELYDNYAHIREGLKRAPNYVVAAKAYCYDEDNARASLEKAMRGMGRDYIDLFLLHEQEDIYTLRGHEKALAYLTRQKERGHVGAVGVSTHYVSAVRSAPLFGMIDVIFPILNRAGVGIADGTRREMEDAMARAHDLGAGVYVMKALGGGHLLSDRRAAFDYILPKPYVDSVAIGMQRESEIDYNVSVFEGGSPDENLAARESRRLLIDFWCEGCGKCVSRCPQGALRLENGKSTVDPNKCVFCGYCGSVCPQFCIKVV